MRRRLLSCLPAAAAVIVAWAVLGDGEQRLEFARVLGGPPRGGVYSLLVSATALESGRRAPLPGLRLRVTARADGRSASASGVTGATGHLETAIELPVSATAPWLRVEREHDGAVLAQGELELDLERWRAGARREGGWLPGRGSGELSLEVAIAAGVLAVPFEGQLLVRVRGAPGEGARPVPDAALEVELAGAELAAPLAPSTDARGSAELALRPLEHSIAARVSARAGARHGQWYGALPVVPGALSAALAGDSLWVRSPIPRAHAFLSLVTEDERVGGAVVELAPGPDGTASGRHALDPAQLERLRAEPTWAVVSSADDKRSPGVVGWPLGAALASAPSMSLAVAEAVLLDGQAGALHDRAARRASRRGVAGVLLLAIATLTGVSFWREVQRRSQRPRSLVLARDGWLLAAALASIALGLGALAYFGMLQR